MSTIEKSRNKPPVVPPLDSPFWRDYESEFTLPTEPFPKGHLVGRVILEDRVAAAETRLEQGLPIDDVERDLLTMSREFLDDAYAED